MDLASRLLPIIVGYVGVMLFKFPDNILPAAIFAVATISLLGSWFHDAVHRITTLPRPLMIVIAHIAAA
jgi:hypothetical protein